MPVQAYLFATYLYRFGKKIKLKRFVGDTPEGLRSFFNSLLRPIPS